MGKKTAPRITPATKKVPQKKSLPLPKWITFKTAGILCCILAVFAIGIIVGRKSTEHPVPDGMSSVGSINVKPGPWGNLLYLPITISAPEAILKVTGVEEESVQWVFEGYSRASLARVLGSSGVSAELQNALLNSPSPSGSQNNLVLNPSRETVDKLASSGALASVYKILGKSRGNEQCKWPVLVKNVDKFRDLGISGATTSLLKKMSCQAGNFLVCYCMPYVLAAIPAYEEKVSLIKALSRQETMLLRMKITPETNVDALVSYWGKGRRSSNVRALLESLKNLPNGGTLSVAQLLPTLPTSLLYTFPMPQNKIIGTTPTQNCSWTAMNFFCDSQPDPKLSDANVVVATLQKDYYTVQSDPEFGDVAVFVTPDNLMVHLAVYIADDIVYTKNGPGLQHPWIFSHISDLLESYSFVIEPGQKLSVTYFRKKIF